MQSWLAIIPVILSLVLIITTKRTTVSLLSGFVLGALIFQWEDLTQLPAYLAETALNAISSPWHYSALIFTILLGGFGSLIQAGGGLQRLFHKTTSVRGLQLRTIGLGLLCFFDGLASGVIIARVVQPIADRIGLSREKLAYLADTTSSAIACIAPVSTWIAMQLGLIGTVLSARDLDTSPYALFLHSIPLNFYCLLSLVLAVGLAVTGYDYGPMARTSANKPEGKKSAAQSSLAPALISLIALLLSIPVLYYCFEVDALLPFSWGKLGSAMGGNSGPTVLIASGLGCLILLFFLSPAPQWKQKFSATALGMRNMLQPLLVLLCAWLFGAVIKDLGLAGTLSQLLGDSLSPRFLPLCTFLLGCLLSFTTGTSWGTMALLFPISFGLTEHLSDETFLSLAPILIAAIFSGSVFGDHCSPYSDTTIISASAAGCHPYDHVRTQLPYALSCGLISALAFFAASLSV